MVFVSKILAFAKRIPNKYLRTNFIDSLRIHVTGGTGGAGLPRYGGIGGAGGNIYVIGDEKTTLKDVRSKSEKKRFKAPPGGDSSSRGIIGVRGEDMNIQVPVGISVYNEHGMKMGDIDKPHSKLLVAKGGLGGCPETDFCSVRGEARTIVLDLKLIADVGLIGFPNAGKSTFLNAISKARPKIASYPFTTLTPQVGTISYDDFRQITVADLPGLIEGAHANIGMGYKFLKHVERTKVLLFIVDIQGFQLSYKYVHRSCLETLVLLNKEIELYKSDLLNMPSMLIVNKMDTENADKLYNEIESDLRDLSQFVAKCPEEMRPTRIIQFDNIMKASLALKKPDELDYIKQILRQLIDKREEEIVFKDNSMEQVLREKLKQQTRQHVPTLV